MNEKFIRNAVDAVDRWTDKEERRPGSGGEPGTPVPTVDPEDLKAVWDFSAEVRRERGSQVSIDISVFKRLCKPDADVKAVCYRSSMIQLLASFLATQQLAPKGGTLDTKVFKAAAEVPMAWMGEGVHQGLPFDAENFLKLLQEQ